MEVFLFNKKDRDQYDAFLINSKHKDILQSWAWGEVKAKFNWSIQRIGFLKKGQIIGIAQIFKRKLPFGFSLYYIPRGPIIDWDEPGLVNEAIQAVKTFFIENKDSKTIFLRLEPPAQNKGATEALRSNGFREYFKTVQPPSTLLIDLIVSEEKLFKNFRRTARNLIHRSEKEGVKVEVLEKINQNDLKSFYNLYRLTGKRFSFPLRPFKQFSLLVDEMSVFPVTRFYVAKIKGLVLACGIVLVLGDKAFYIWGGTARHKHYSKFFNYGYIWGMLKDLKAAGVKTFDFWGLGPENDKKHPWHGFSLFKTAFDGRRFNYAGAFDLPASSFYFLFRLADKIITPKYRATSS